MAFGGLGFGWVDSDSWQFVVDAAEILAAIGTLVVGGIAIYLTKQETTRAAAREAAETRREEARERHELNASFWSPLYEAAIILRTWSRDRNAETCAANLKAGAEQAIQSLRRAGPVRSSQPRVVELIEESYGQADAIAQGLPRGMHAIEQVLHDVALKLYGKMTGFDRPVLQYRTSTSYQSITNDELLVGWMNHEEGLLLVQLGDDGRMLCGGKDRPVKPFLDAFWKACESHDLLPTLRHLSQSLDENVDQLEQAATMALG